MAVGLHRTGKSGGLAMENDEEGCAPPTADVADFEVAARGENSNARRPWGKRRAAVDHTSPAHADALGGCAQQPAASPPPTRGG